MEYEQPWNMGKILLEIWDIYIYMGNIGYYKKNMLGDILFGNFLHFANWKPWPIEIVDLPN